MVNNSTNINKMKSNTIQSSITICMNICFPISRLKESSFIYSIHCLEKGYIFSSFYSYPLLREQAIFTAGMGPVQMGMGHWFFLTLHIHGANIFFTNEMPMGQILFLMHYFVAEFSWMNKKNYRNSKNYCPLTSSLRAPSSEENIILYIDGTSNFKHSYTCSNHQINLIFYNYDNC